VCTTSWLIWIFCLSILTTAAGQSKQQDLEKRRSQLLEEIKLTNRQLEKTKTSQKNELQQFQILKEQARNREKLVQHLLAEIKSVNSEIAKAGKELDQLEAEITQLKQEYAAILQKTYRIKLGTDPLMLILSADNFNQAFQRWIYVNQIKRMRSEQAGVIKTKQMSYREKITQLEVYKKTKEKLAQEEVNQKQKIDEEAKQKEALIANLKQDEQSLRSQISEKDKQQKQLQKEIEKLIQEAIRKAKEEERERKRKEKEEEERRNLALKNNSPQNQEDKPSADVASKPKATPKPTPPTPAATALSEDFSKNKGKLPWPVERGTISKRFGTQAHDVVSNIMITNNGIDIRTEPNAPVKAIFKGKVIGKKYIPDQHYMVLLQHGKYYTVYSNIVNIAVKEGQEVNPGTIIGYATGDESTTTEVHFELWQEFTTLDPSTWLKK
jgi:septal ring factor EnvC (AmiA/AmiB activator)